MQMLVRTKDDNAALRFDMREMTKERDSLLESKTVILTQLENLRDSTQPNVDLVSDLSLRKREMSGQMAALESELRTSRNEAAEMRQEMLVKTETASVLSAQIMAIQKKGTVVSYGDMQVREKVVRMKRYDEQFILTRRLRDVAALSNA